MHRSVLAVVCLLFCACSTLEEERREESGVGIIGMTRTGVTHCADEAKKEMARIEREKGEQSADVRRCLELMLNRSCYEAMVRRAHETKDLAWLTRFAGGASGGTWSRDAYEDVSEERIDREIKQCGPRGIYQVALGLYWGASTAAGGFGWADRGWGRRPSPGDCKSACSN
ncbi:hypothetical protein DRW03_21185 [Corallococcus sp. H22C18031201]|nr:hypothetical protein DRW03_21185 [Corallococcus sp. H22C18031201]